MAGQVLLTLLIVSTFSVCLSRPSVSRRNDDHGNYGYNYEITHSGGSSRVHMDAGAHKADQNGINILDSSYGGHDGNKRNLHNSYQGAKDHGHDGDYHYEPSVTHEPQPFYPPPYDSSSKKPVGDVHKTVPVSQVPYDATHQSSYSVPSHDYYQNAPSHKISGYPSQVHVVEPVIQEAIPVQEHVPISQDPYTKPHSSNYLGEGYEKTIPAHQTKGYPDQVHVDEPIAQISVPVQDHDSILQVPYSGSEHSTYDNSRYHHPSKHASQVYVDEPIVQNPIQVVPVQQSISQLSNNDPYPSSYVAPPQQQYVAQGYENEPAVQKPVAAEINAPIKTVVSPVNEHVQKYVPVASDNYAPIKTELPRESYQSGRIEGSHSACNTCKFSDADKLEVPLPELGVHDGLNPHHAPNAEGPKYVLVPSGPPYVQVGHTAEIVHGPAPVSSHVALPAPDPVVPISHSTAVQPVVSEVGKFYPVPEAESPVVAVLPPITHSTRLLLPVAAKPIETTLDAKAGLTDAVDASLELGLVEATLDDPTSHAVEEVNHLPPISHSFRLRLPVSNSPTGDVKAEIESFVDKDNSEISAPLHPEADLVPPISHAFRLNLPLASNDETIPITKEEFDEYDVLDAYDIPDLTRLPLEAKV